MAGRHAQQSRATPASTGKLQWGLGQARHTRGVGRQAKQHNVPFAKGHGASDLCRVVGLLGSAFAALPHHPKGHRPHQGRKRQHADRQGRGSNTNDDGRGHLVLRAAARAAAHLRPRHSHGAIRNKGGHAEGTQDLRGGRGGGRRKRNGRAQRETRGAGRGSAGESEGTTAQGRRERS